MTERDDDSDTCGEYNDMRIMLEFICSFFIYIQKSHLWILMSQSVIKLLICEIKSYRHNNYANVL